MLSVETIEMCRNTTLPGGTGLRRGGFSMWEKKQAILVVGGGASEPQGAAEVPLSKVANPHSPLWALIRHPAFVQQLRGSAPSPVTPTGVMKERKRGEKKPIFLVVHCEHVSEHVVQAEIICKTCCVVTDGNGDMKQALPVAATLRMGAGPHVEEASLCDCSVTCWRRGSHCFASSRLLLCLTDIWRLFF